jgi:hypothetical protein
MIAKFAKCNESPTTLTLNMNVKHFREVLSSVVGTAIDDLSAKSVDHRLLGYKTLILALHTAPVEMQVFRDQLFTVTCDILRGGGREGFAIDSAVMALWLALVRTYEMGVNECDVCEVLDNAHFLPDISFLEEFFSFVIYGLKRFPSVTSGHVVRLGLVVYPCRCEC